MVENGFKISLEFGGVTVPAIHGRSSKENYQYIVDRINQKLTGWKAKCLSLAGRATLAQSCISSVPYYTMQSTKLPKLVCDEVDHKTRRFLWGGTEEKKGLHLVNWDTVSSPKEEGGLGFRSMRQANSAFLTKLGWCLLAEPNALRARIMRHKYCAGRCDLDMFNPKQDASNAWRGIVENAATIRKGVNSSIGNGRATLFWHQNWVENRPLIEFAIKDVPQEFQELTVHEMWDQNTGWKFVSLSEFLPADILKKIDSFEICEDEDAVDSLYWNDSPNGGFTIKSAMNIIRNSDPSLERKEWRLVWKFPMLQRIRMFFWLVFHNRLMSNTNRMVRGFTNDSSCWICGEMEESIEHILRLCPAARVLWSKLGFNPLQDVQDIPFHRWLLYNLDDTNVSPRWSLVFMVTCWWLWKWRCATCFERASSVPLDQKAFIMDRVKDIDEALNLNSNTLLTAVPRRQEVLLRWLPPPAGWVRLNTDGAGKGNPGPSGGGAVARDAAGKVLRAVAFNFGSCTSLLAELLAVLRGLAVLWNDGFRRVVLTTDSEVVHKLLVHELPPCHPYFHTLRRCLMLLHKEGWEVRVEHCYRETNRVADWLTNFGVTASSRISFFEPLPAEARVLADEDLPGVCWPRAVLVSST